MAPAEPATGDMSEPLRTGLLFAGAVATVVGVALLARKLRPAPVTNVAPALDASQGAALLRRTTPAAELQRMETLLRDGVITRRTEGGRLPQVTIANPANPAETIQAVLKARGAPAEEFGYRVARALGIDYLVPRTVRRADGAAAIEFIPGVHLDRAGITNGTELRAAIERHYANRLGLSPDDATRMAKVDHELLQFFDWFTANRDRKAPNAIFNAVDDTVHWIDNAGALRGERLDPLRPRLKDAYYITSPLYPHRIDLSAETRAIVRERLTDTTLRELHDVLRRPHPMPLDDWERAVLRRARSDHQLQRLIVRRDAAVTRGYIEYAPVTPESRHWEARYFNWAVRNGVYPTWGGAPVPRGGEAVGEALEAAAAGGGAAT